MKRHYYLTPVLGGPGAPRYPISDKPRMVGRSERAEIALLEPTVSREHAAVQCRDGSVHLEDLGSKHGTFVNSKRIKATKLKIGDIIVFGLSLVLRLEESDAPIAMPQPAHGEPPTATVSAIEPLPQAADRGDRHAETQVTSLDSLSPGRSSLPPAQGEDANRLLDQLVKTRKLAGVGAYCATALPEIYRQLGQLTELLEADPDLTADAMIDPVRQLQDELAGVLRVAHVPTPSLGPTNLFDVLRRAVATAKPVAAPRDVDLLVGVPADVNVVAEPQRLEAALAELLRNAATASPEGQPVEIEAEVHRRSVHLTLTDHGQGFPPSVAERLFEPFFTHRGDRTAVGLGLFEARQLVLSMGGRLAVESGKGKTVTTLVLRLC